MEGGGVGGESGGCEVKDELSFYCCLSCTATTTTDIQNSRVVHFSTSPVSLQKGQQQNCASSTLQELTQSHRPSW